MKKITCILTIHLGSICFGCGAEKSQAPEPQITQSNANIVESYVCEDQYGNTLKCECDTDCCEGFVCIPDHSVGHRTKVCVSEE